MSALVFDVFWWEISFSNSMKSPNHINPAMTLPWQELSNSSSNTKIRNTCSLRLSKVKIFGLVSHPASWQQTSSLRPVGMNMFGVSSLDNFQNYLTQRMDQSLHAPFLRLGDATEWRIEAGDGVTWTHRRHVPFSPTERASITIATFLAQKPFCIKRPWWWACSRLGRHGGWL